MLYPLQNIPQISQQKPKDQSQHATGCTWKHEEYERFITQKSFPDTDI